MSFLDNLESNLKSLEGREERDSQREHLDRTAARARALAVAPFAAELRSGPFAKALLGHASRIGFGLRVKVRIAWIGDTLRLEAGEKRLDLQPTEKGVEAGFFESGQLLRALPVDLSGDAEALAHDWLRLA
jgi:hypothetical protein